MMIEKGSKMSKKMLYSEVMSELREFSTASRAKYDSYAHATGFLESMVGNLIADLPAHKQAEALRYVRQVKQELV
jgi:hypothetical protein